MEYGDAVHGWWCDTRTLPMRCRYCGESVFYFTCDHGCRVLFDALGFPWPEHRCLEYLTAQYGPEFIEQGMAIMMMTPGVEVGRKIDSAQAERAQARAKQPLEPLPCEPRDGDMTKEVGTVTEVCEVVNLAKQLGITTETPIGDSLLRALGATELGRITIQTGSLEEDEIWSFTFYVPRDLLRKRSLVRGDLVRCQLRAIGVPGLSFVWFSDDLEGGW